MSCKQINNIGNYNMKLLLKHLNASLSTYRLKNNKYIILIILIKYELIICIWPL